MTPEEEARQEIDRLLEAADWQVQDYKNLNLGAALGVAIREFPLESGRSDYLLFVDRIAVGAIEASLNRLYSWMASAWAALHVGLAMCPLWSRPGTCPGWPHQARMLTGPAESSGSGRSRLASCLGVVDRRQDFLLALLVSQKNGGRCLLDTLAGIFFPAGAPGGLLYSCFRKDLDQQFLRPASSPPEFPL